MKFEGRHFPNFEQIPDDAFINDWRAHITATGCPEDFHQVSTSVPEQHENINLLSEEISVPISLRPNGDLVPCPFCAPDSPKFMRGRMAHFPDEKVIRFIGHRCAATHFGENYRHAERAFKRQKKCRQYIDLWKQIAPQYGDLVQFIDLMAKSADDLQFVRDELDRQAPGLSGFLHGELAQTNGDLFINVDLGGKDRHGNAVIQRKQLGTANGLRFLDRDYDISRQVKRGRSALSTVEDDLPEWTPSSPEHPSTDEILKRGQLVQRALERIPEMLEDIKDGLLFLRPRNIAMIHQWGNRVDNPYTRFEVKSDDRQVRIRCNSFAGEHYANVVIPPGAKLAVDNLPAPDLTPLTSMVA